MSEIREKKLSTWIIVNGVLLFMFCVFAPIDAYFANSEEFWFSLSQMFIINFVIFIALLGSSYLMGCIICRTKVLDIGIYIIFFFLIFFYIQGNYIPRKYGVLNGENIVWRNYNGYAIASIVVALACLLVTFLIIIKGGGRSKKIIEKIAIFIFLIQTVTICVLIVKNGIATVKTNRNNELIVTSENLYKVSDKKNVIVFILDTYDGEYFQELYKEDAEKQNKIFENFTYYKDTLGGYPTTKASIPLILTGERYYNDIPYDKYIEEAHNNSKIFDQFRKNDYEIDIYTEGLFLGKDASKYSNVYTGKYIISNPLTFAKEIYKLIAFNYMPHHFKRFFMTNTQAFQTLKETSLGQQSAYSANVVEFANKLRELGLTRDNNHNIFKIIHLDGVHLPATFDERLIEDGGDYSYLDEAIGNNAMLKSYFEEMKKIGVYDNSTIIIMADHGHIGYSQNPIFMIKNPGEKHDFAISNEKMSYDYLRDIWLAIADGDKVDENFISYENSKMGGLRKFIFYRWDDSWNRKYMPAMEEMYCQGYAFESSSLLPTGNCYYAEKEDYKYTLGSKLEFINKGDRRVYNYVRYGVSNGQLMNKAQLLFDLDGDYDNIEVIIKTSKDSYGIFSVLSNENTITELNMSCKNDESISFVIPNKYINNGKVDLSFVKYGTNSIDDAFTPSSVVIESILIKSTDKNEEYNEQKDVFAYTLGREISLTAQSEESACYTVEGFSFAEDWGTWSLGNKTEFLFKNIDNGKDLVFEYDCIIINQEQIARVYANGVYLDEYQIKKGINKIRIPRQAIADGALDITFELPNAKSPEELGLSSDGRVLSIGFKTIKLSEERKYNYGEVISFYGEDSSCIDYIGHGFSAIEQSLTWTDGNEAILNIPVEKSDNNLELIMQVGAFNGEQIVEVYVDEEPLNNFIINQEGEYSLLIPSSYTHDGILDIKMLIPNANSPYNLGLGEDQRMLGLYFYSIVINNV